MKKMKKVIAGLLACAMLLSGCSAAGNDKDKDPMAPRTYQVASGSSSGAYYLQITPIAALWENLDFITSCRVQASSGALENTVVISKGMADAGLIDAFAYFAAVDGTEPYKNSYGGFSAIAAGAPSIATIVVKENSDIHTLADLKGHSIAVGLAGSGAEFEERFILEALGMTYSDFTQVEQIGIGPGFTAFQDGKVDAVIALMGAGNSNLVETMTNVDVRIIPFSDEEKKTVMEKCAFLVDDMIPGGSYAGIDEDINSVSIPAILVVSDSLPDEAVYQMTETVYDNIETLKATNKNFNNWSFGPHCAGNVPLHPGAVKFYEDRGIN